MAETAAENKVRYEVVADMGSGLVIAKVHLADIREQDINARIMKNETQKQLTDNIKKRGQLESLPYCALIDGRIEIISGHHRIRSAKDSGVLEEVFVILDLSGLRRSQVAAKQIAHNAINGYDDQSTLREIAKLIDDVDDMLESYIGKDILEEPMAELEKLLGSAFFRCHRGYLVNLDKIRSYDRESIKLTNGSSLILSKTKYAEFVDAYMHYLALEEG